MRLRSVPCLALAMAAVVAMGAWAGEADVDSLAKQLKGEGDAPALKGAELQAAHAKVLAALLPKLASEKIDERTEAQRTYRAICWRASRPGADAERAAACAAILARLKPDLPKLALLHLLEQLEHIGREEAVAAVVPLLNHEDAEPPFVRERARRVLAANPSPKAMDALRTALARAKDPLWTIGLANALGARRDKAAVPELLELARSKDQEVRLAAVEALARIGDKTGAEVIAAASTGAAGRPWRVAIVSYLLLADNLVAQKDSATALDMYRALLEADDFVKCGAIIGVGRAGGAGDLGTLFAALGDADIEVRAAGKAALELLPADAVREAVAKKTKTATPEMKVLLIQILAERGDRSVLPTLVACASDADESVRIAACQAMTRVGGREAMPVLIAALGKAKGKELETVKAAIVGIPGKEATLALVEAMGTGSPELRAEIVRALAARRDEAATPALLEVAGGADAKLRAEAYKALGNYAGGGAAAPLIELLLKASSKSDREAAEKALVAACGRIEAPDARATAVLAALPKASGAARCSLLRVLGRLGGAKALEAVRTALKTDSEALRDAAIRALADWPDASPAADLLEVARTTKSVAHNVLALRGALRVLALPTDRPAADTLALYAGAMKAARRPDEEKEVLGALAGVSSLGALKQVEPFLDDPELKAEAAAAAATLATALIGSHREEARTALKKLLDAAPSDAVRKNAQAALDQLEKFEDYVTAWEVSGPYTVAGRDGPGLHSEVLPPEKQGAKVLPWAVMPPGGGKPPFPFYMDLYKRHSKENAAAYLRTWVWSPRQQQARMEFGSDDGAKLWLNGTLAIDAAQPRSFELAKDKVVVSLKQGWNAVLVKVWNGSLHWGAALRFRKPDGSRLEGLRTSLKPE